MRVDLLSESELHYRLLSHLAKERDLMSGQIKNPSQFYYQGMPDFILREGQFSNLDLCQRGSTILKSDIATKTPFRLRLKRASSMLKDTLSLPPITFLFSMRGT